MGTHRYKKIAAAIATAVGGIWLLLTLIPSGSEQRTQNATLTVSVDKHEIRQVVVESGTLRNQDVHVVKCELKGRNHQITRVVEENTFVKEGETVIWFDTSGIDEQIQKTELELIQAKSAINEATRDLKVQENKNKGELAAAKLEIELTTLALERYRDGDYKVQKNELEGAIAQSKADLSKKQNDVESVTALVKKGFRSLANLEEAQLLLDRAAFNLKRDELKLQVLNDFEFKEKIAELESKKKEAERALNDAEYNGELQLKNADQKLESAQRNEAILVQRLDDLKLQLGFCEAKAVEDGRVAMVQPFKNYFPPQPRVEVGNMVNQGRRLFYVPDNSKMKVDIEISEAAISRVKVGQVARVRLSAYSGELLEGEVSKVSELGSDSGSSESQTYEVTVLIRKAPESIQMKPGMSAQVEIETAYLENPLALSHNSIVEHEGKYYVFAIESDQIKKREVQIGVVGKVFIEIREGVEQGEVVVSNARKQLENELLGAGKE